MYWQLDHDWRLIRHDSYLELFRNSTIEEYLLDEAQFQLLLNLNGTLTEEQLLHDYDPDSKPVIKEFLKSLEDVGAVRRLSQPQIRMFPQLVVTPYLEAVLWDITSACNLQCTHCYVSEYFAGAKGQDLSTVQVFRVIEEMARMNVRDVSLTGGEPLMRKDLQDIISKIISSGIRLASLFTNGLLVTPEFISFLKQIVPNQQKFRIRHSLDGMTPESNAVLRGDKMNPKKLFEGMLDSIRMFIAAGFFVSVGTGLHRLNVAEIPHMYEFMKDLGIAQWRMAVPKPLGRFTENQNDLGASWPEILRAYKELIDKHLAEVKVINGEVFSKLNIEIEQVFRTELVVKTMNTFIPEDIACFYHKNRCSLKANGDVVPCGYFDKVVAGNVKEVSLQTAWQSENMQSVKHICLSDITDCRGCKLLRTCGTGCRAIAHKTGGSLTAKDPYACEQAPFMIETVVPLMEKYGFKLALSEGCEEFSLGGQEAM